MILVRLQIDSFVIILKLNRMFACSATRGAYTQTTYYFKHALSYRSTLDHLGKQR